MAEVDLDAELELEGSAGKYKRAISPRWDVGGRAFGGYGAALALQAMTTETELALAQSLYVMFLNPLDFGAIEIEVTTLRRGRRVAAARATATQGEREVLTATAWLTVSRSGVNQRGIPHSVTPER